MRKNKFAVLFLALIIAVAGCTKKPAPQDTGALPFSETIVHGVLDNGMRYYIKKNDLPLDKVELRLNVRTGSLNETEEERGVAHFVEHMAFNGTTNFKGNDIIKFMEEAGLTFGVHSNAYTSFENTNYQLSVPSGDMKLLDDSLMIFREWADGITFEQEEIDKEKGVITEEWRSNESAQYRMGLKARELMYAGSLYPARDAIGLMEVISGADTALLKGYYDKWYTPENMAVIVVGNVEPDDVLPLIKKHFASMEKRAAPQPSDKTVPITEGLRVAVLSDPEATATSVSLMYFSKEGSLETYDQLKKYILESGAMSMLNSRVSNKRFENKSNLLAFSGAKGSGSDSQIAVTNFAITTDPETMDSDIKELLTEIERARQFGFTADELEEYAAAQKMAVDRAASPDYKYSSGSYADAIAGYETGGGHLTDFAQDKVLLDKIFSETNITSYNRAFAKLLSSESTLVIIRAPERELGEIDMDEAKFAAIRDEVAGMKLAPEGEGKAIDKLVEGEPEGGKIKSRTVYENIGGELVTYENGVRLFIKTNGVNKNRYIMNAKKEGGASVLGDMDAIYADRIPQALAISGFDGISRRQLQRYLADKRAVVTPTISEYAFEFAGGGDTEDIEIMFQLLYKYLTAAVVDDNALSAIKRNYEVALRNQEKDTRTLFVRAAVERAYNTAYRRGYLLAGDLPGMSADVLLKIYKDNFLDANNFIFVISGDVEPELAAELGQKYLGSIEFSQKPVKAVDRGVRLKSAYDRYDGYGDLADRSTVSISLDANGKHIDDGRYLSAMADRVLRQKMRESIREDMGGVYGVGSSIAYSDFPAPAFSSRVVFSCEPERRDEIIAEVMEILKSMAENGVSEEELDVAKTQYSLALDTANEDNGYWVAAISNNFIRGEKTLSIDEMKALINSLTAEQVNKFTKTFLQDARMFISVYNPECKGEQCK